MNFLCTINEYSSVIEAVSAVVVAFFAVFSFFSWRTSVRILNQQQRAELAQNRPYISVNDSIIKKKNLTEYEAWFSIKNMGKTPAHSVVISNYYESNKISVVIGGDRGGSGGLLGPELSWKFKLDWSQEQINRILYETSDYYVMEITYKDYLENKYKFIAELNIKPVNDSFEFFIKSQREIPIT